MRTFAIITTNPDALMAELHARIPVILEPQDWPTWFGEVESDQVTLTRPAGKDVLKV